MYLWFSGLILTLMIILSEISFGTYGKTIIRSQVKCGLSDAASIIETEGRLLSKKEMKRSRPQGPSPKGGQTILHRNSAPGRDLSRVICY